MHPELARFASTQYGVFLAGQALVVGYSRDQIARMVRTGVWTRLHRGVYADAAWLERQDPPAVHLAHARGLQLQMGAQIAWSHRTAAIAHGLPLLHRIPELPELTVERGHRRTAPGARLFANAMKDGHTTRTSGNARLTTVARTISDIARVHGSMAAMVSGDHAVRHGLLAENEVAIVLRDCKMWKGIPRFKDVLPLLDGRSETPGESVSRWQIVSHGLLRPELQFEIVIRGRRFRTDFAWPSLRLIGEFDGRVKYGTANDLFAEKLREDDLRGEGWRVVRWTWADLWGSPEPPFIAALRRAMADARSSAA
jgi:very-short-patch-repair endonuclease